MPAGIHYDWFLHLLQEYDLIHTTFIQRMDPYLTLYKRNGIKRVAMKESCSYAPFQSLKKSVELL